MDSKKPLPSPNLLIISLLTLIVAMNSHLVAAEIPLGENAVLNGDFHQWSTYQGHGVTTTSQGVPPRSIPDDWYGGPGVGATATYDVVPFPSGQTDVPGNPGRHLRVTWKSPPAGDWPGEGHHQPGFRFSFLEYFGIRDVRAFTAKDVMVTFYARSPGKDPAAIIPILWHSYDSETPGITGVKGKGYELFESSGKPGLVRVASGAPNQAAVCRLTNQWQRFEKRISLPLTEGRSITPGHYTGVGFDLAERGAPTIDIANVEVRTIETP